MESMLRAYRDRRDQDEKGFTLIELMVVVLIIAILIAIAIPTFLGARSRAQDRAAQSNLRNGVTAAKTIFSDAQDYALATATELAVVEPSLTFVAGGPSTAAKEIGFSTGAPTGGTDSKDKEVILWAKSESGQCFGIRDIQEGSTGTTATQYMSYAATGGNCAAPSGTWQDGSF